MWLQLQLIGTYLIQPADMRGDTDSFEFL